MFEYNGARYELKYGLKRIEMAENALKRPVYEIMRGGALSMTELVVLFGYGMLKEGANAWEPPKKAMTIAEAMLQMPGAYAEMTDLIAEAIQRDCPFFFPAGS